MTDEEKQPTGQTEDDKIIMLGNLTDSEIKRLIKAWASLVPDDSFVGKPKRVCDPRRARPI